MVSGCNNTGIFLEKTHENVIIHKNQKDLEERREYLKIQIKLI
jgi:hypothetical protein